MKNIYIKPDLKSYIVHIEHSLLTTSQTGVSVGGTGSVLIQEELQETNDESWEF